MSKRWNRAAPNSNAALARSFLEVLLGPPRSRGPASQGGREDWTCTKCTWSNFGSRSKCRHCGAARPGGGSPQGQRAGAKPASGPGPGAPAPPKPAPWEKARAAATRASALEAALAAAKIAGGDGELVKELEGKLEAARKASTDARPLTDQLTGCREYLERARKRLEKAEQAVNEATKHRDELARDVTDHEARLEELENEAEAARPSPAAPTAVDMPVDTAAPGVAAERLELLEAELRRAQEEAAVLRNQNEDYLAKGSALEQEVTEAKVAATAVKAENEELQRRLQGAQAPPTEPAIDGDASTLQQELQSAQETLRTAFEDKDAKAYEAALEKHAGLARALARAMRKAPRR